jgi:dynein heavy chain
LLRDYYSPTIFDPQHCFADMPDFIQPPATDYDSVMKHIQGFPLFPKPQVFGFHSNASFTKSMFEAYQLFEAMLTTESAAGASGGKSEDEIVGEIAADILARVPKPWNTADVQKKYPLRYEESMNTVLVQELTRYNRLIAIVLSSLKDIQKAVKGLVLMSEDLEAAFYSLFDGKTPALWIAKSYPSLKPLGSYVTDFVDRLAFFQTWVDEGIPVVFWFSGMFFTQAFTTGSTQNFARKFTIPIDQLAFNFYFPREQNQTERPPDGLKKNKILKLF